MDDDELLKLLERIVEELGDHFESVQIMASFTDGEGSTCLKRGFGNWYARQGMAHEFINEDMAREIGNQMPKPEGGDDDEAWKEGK